MDTRDTTPPALKVGKYALVNGYLLFAVGIFYLAMDLWNLIEKEWLKRAFLWPSFPYWMTNEFEISSDDENYEITLKGACFRDTAVIRSIADCLWLVALLLMFRKLWTQGRCGSLTFFAILFWLEVIIFAIWKLFPLMKEFSEYRYTICYITAAFLVIIFYVCHTLNTLRASFALLEQSSRGLTAVLTIYSLPDEQQTLNQLEKAEREEQKPVLPDPMPTIVVDEKGKVYSEDSRSFIQKILP